MIEDAAQALGSTYLGTPLGRFGALAATSFHETKNVIAGEGGALLINDASLVARAEILRDKGTDRSRFLRGEVDKYTWIDIGSSFAPSELTAAFLWAQLEEAETIRERRLEIWRWYADAFAALERRGLVRLPVIPPGCEHNAHMFYVLVNDAAKRPRLLADLNDAGINAVFHYVPLHSAPAAARHARTAGTTAHTDSTAARLVRLPLWIGMERWHVEAARDVVERSLGQMEVG